MLYRERARTRVGEFRARDDGLCPHRASVPEEVIRWCRARSEGSLEGGILPGFRRRRAGEQGCSLPPPAPQASLSLFR
jgi:hypothetical protein